MHTDNRNYLSQKNQPSLDGKYLSAFGRVKNSLF